MDSGLVVPAPLAFNVSSASNSSDPTAPALLLDSCTLSTSCDNLAQFTAWLGGLSADQVQLVQVGGWPVCLGGWMRGWDAGQSPLCHV